MNHQPNTPASLNEAVAAGALADAIRSAEDILERVALSIGRKTTTQDECEWRYSARIAIGGIRWELARSAALAAPGAAIDAREQEDKPGDEAAEIIGNLIAGIEKHGMYSKESTLMCLTQAYYSLRPENPPLASREEAPAASAQGSPELLLGWKRYEKARKLSPFQWNRLHIRNLAGENFDAMIDSLPEPTTPVPTPSDALSPATVAQPVTEDDDKRNARGASFRVEDLKLPLPALPEPFIASTEIGYSLHRAPEVLRFGADCYRLAQAAQPCASQGCGGAVEDCAVDVYSSRMCERGTKGCTASHAALSTDKSGGA